LNSALHFGDRLTLPSWLLILSLTASVSFWWIARRADAHRYPRRQALDLGLIIGLGMILGGRLFHVFFEQPDYYMQNPSAIFYIWQGGFVYYGGLLFSLLLAWFWCWREKLNPWRFADFFAPVLGAAHAAGRLGCFLNGCCYGKVCDWPWAVRFTSHESWGLAVVPRHPTQLYALVWEAIAVGLVLLLEKRPRAPGFIFSLWLAAHAIGRLMMEHFRDDDRGPMLGGFSVGTWISLALLTLAGSRLILSRRNTRQT
jgi:phosphatidylglycerol---prolipoprotein diacylglyceryl transferase